VEATAEVKDPKLRARLQEILNINLSDDVLAWTMHPDGTYAKVPTVKGIDAHETLQELALARASGKDARARRRA
jgi:polyphosphate kinase